MSKLSYAIIAILAVLSAVQTIRYNLLLLQIGDLYDSTDVFLGLTKETWDTYPSILADHLDYIDRYYRPPYSRFISKDSPIESAVERMRILAGRYLMNNLQRITEANYGYDIDRWIQEYASLQNVEARFSRTAADGRGNASYYYGYPTPPYPSGQGYPPFCCPPLLPTEESAE